MSVQQQQPLASLSSDRAHVFKLCMDLVSTNTVSCNFDISPNGLHIAHTDTKSAVFITLSIPAENLTTFHLNAPATVSFAVPSKTLFKVLKSMRKRDSLEIRFFPENMLVRVFPDQRDRVVEASIKTQIVRTIVHAEPPSGMYHTSLTIVASDFTKLLKDLCAATQSVTITTYPTAVKFESATKRVVFGDNVVDTDTVTDGNNGPSFTGEFDTSSLISVLKITSISRTLGVAAEPDMPIRLCVETGTIGMLNVYLKPVELKN